MEKTGEKGVLTMLTYGPPLEPGAAVVASAAQLGNIFRKLSAGHSSSDKRCDRQGFGRYECFSKLG